MNVCKTPKQPTVPPEVIFLRSLHPEKFPAGELAPVKEEKYHKSFALEVCNYK
jgi:hypothetical protein